MNKDNKDITEDKPLNEAEILSIKRLWQKGLQAYEIAERIGISEGQVLRIVKPKTFK